jgi:hypothetical protein
MHSILILFNKSSKFTILSLDILIAFFIDFLKATTTQKGWLKI